MNQQQIFDKVITHLINQNVKAYNTYGCVYYGTKNTKCAVGRLIPEQWYNPDLETFSPKKLLEYGMIPDVEFTDENVELLTFLQDVHDNPAWNTFDQPEFFQAVRMKVKGFSGDLELPEVFLQAEARCL